MPRAKKTGLADGAPPATARTRGPHTNAGFSLAVYKIASLAAELDVEEKLVKTRLQKALETVAIDHVRSSLKAERHQAEWDDIASMEAALEAKRAALREREAAHQQDA